jgi:hypothetical protein
VTGNCEGDDETSGQKDREFLDHMSDYQFLK